MKPEEALNHNWQEGEKLWEVYYKYNSEIQIRDGFKSHQPVGVIEVTVKTVEIDDCGWFKSVNLELEGDWGLDKESCCYDNTILTTMITYRETGGFYYSNKEFCREKFFTKKEAEKRYKAAVKTWNNKVQRFHDDQKAEIEAARKRYEDLIASGTVDMNLHIIKEEKD